MDYWSQTVFSSYTTFVLGNFCFFDLGVLLQLKDITYFIGVRPLIAGSRQHFARLP